MTDTIWRWRLAAKSWIGTRSPYDTFWAQLMDWLIPKEANKQADQALQGKARDIESVHTTASHARESLQQQHAATVTTIAEAETTALRLSAPVSNSLEMSDKPNAATEILASVIEGSFVPTSRSRPRVTRPTIAAAVGSNARHA